MGICVHINIYFNGLFELYFLNILFLTFDQFMGLGFLNTHNCLAVIKFINS